MCLLLIFFVLQVLTLEFVTPYPVKDYILAYIPIEEFDYLSPQSVTPYPVKDYILAYIPIEELAYLEPQNVEAMPVPYYNRAFFYNPWIFQGMMMQNVRFPYQQTSGPVSFVGPVKSKGGVTITKTFGNQGFNSFTSYSAPPTPLTVTPQPAWPTTSNLLIDSRLPSSPTISTITTLPPVTVPSKTFTQQFKDTMPSAVTVPEMPMPFIVVTTTVPNDVGLNGNAASPVTFSGKVPASGRVKISRHFC